MGRSQRASYWNRDVNSGGDVRLSAEPIASFSDMFLEHNVHGFGNFEHGNEATIIYEVDEGDENSGSVEESKSFWEDQYQLLEGTLRRSSSLESRIRNATKEALKETRNNGCVCRSPVTGGGCRKCLMSVVSSSLRNAGYNSSICKTKWRSSPEIPSGEHTFLDVVDSSNSKRGEVRILIELNFRAEFEMAKASPEYNRLIALLPEVFVGKVERMQAVVKILCTAAKRCMKEKKMHMGPWRKQKYMQAKWFSTPERMASTPTLSIEYSGQSPPKPKASMLTVDLLENLPNMHRMAVAVV